MSKRDNSDREREQVHVIQLVPTQKLYEIEGERDMEEKKRTGS